MIKVIAIGRIKEKSMVAMISEFTKRMKTIHPLEIIELNNSNKPEGEVNSIIEDESQRIMAKLTPKDFVILLDLKGKDLSSPAMAEYLMDKLDKSLPVTFIIGGSHGVSQELRDRSHYLWKLSNLTMPHQFVRVLLVEQIYRMFMIRNKHPYHK